MFDRLSELSTTRPVVASIGLTVGLAALLGGVYAGLNALGQDPVRWLGWALIGCAIAAPLVAGARLAVRHLAATGCAYEPGPYWIERDWHDACRAAGLTTVPGVAQYAGIGCMAHTLAGRFDHDELLLVHPALLDAPRPLIHYTLAVEAARLATHLSTATATGAYYAATTAQWVALWVAGLGLLADPTSGPLLLVAAGTMVTGGIGHVVADRGEDVYYTADAIAHRYMGYRLTDEIIEAAETAEASGTWIYGRFEPDHDTRAEALHHVPGPIDELDPAEGAASAQLRVVLGTHHGPARNDSPDGDER